MDDLKNCPCCGEKANITITAEAGMPSGDKGTKVVVFCQNRECGCKIVKWALKTEWAIESATNAWNNRVKENEAKKPIRANRIIKKNGEFFLNDDNEYWKCPTCTKFDVPLLENQEYCHCCGQALDWSEK